jgi:DNA ligase (NAD+)
VIGPVPQEGKERPAEYEPPTHCPACGTELVGGEDRGMLYCPNFGCPARQLEALVHFASRAAMDIRGLSYARIQQLLTSPIERGGESAVRVHDAADLYDLTVEDLVQLERFAEKSAENLVQAIAASKAQPLSRLVFALGIDYVGEIAARLLARHFGTMARLAAASEDDILAVRGIGDVIAHSAARWFADPQAKKLLRRLEARGLTMDEPSASTGTVFAGQTFVITGTLPSLTREQATALIEANGGRVTSSVSSKTTALVAGADAGSKLTKAQELEVEVIDEAELRRRAEAGAEGV